MNIFTKAKQYLTAKLSHGFYSGGNYSNPFFGLEQMLSSIFGRFAGTSIDYKKEVGELTQSRLIMAAVNFYGRALPEAFIEVVRPKADGTQKVIPDHPLVQLLERPNRFYTGSQI